MDERDNQIKIESEKVRKEKMNARLIWLFLGLIVATLGYIIYQLVRIFN